jgi:ABC-2 type transport system permease protein
MTSEVLEPGKPTLWSELRKAWAISGKDMRIYYFQPAVLIFGLVFPIAIFFSFLIGRSVEASSLFPGLIALTLFFSTTTVAPFSVPWEKMNRTFERLLFAPISLPAAILGKIISSLMYGLIISLVPLAIGLIFFGSHIADYAALILGIALGNICMATLGMLIATVRATTPPKVMMVLNVVRLPLMFMSGIFIAISALPYWGRVLAWFSPLSYTTDLLYRGLGFAHYFNMLTCILVTLGFSVAFYLISIWRMRPGDS